jgi:DNA-binding NtrC family response regulator
VKVDVRIIATSNRNLEQSVQKGEFREDLYFRLNVVNIALPALRERPTDIVTLAQFFADKYADANGVAKKNLSTAAKQKLKAYGWRGNIRELENTMHRAILVSMEPELEPEAIHVQESAFSPAAPPSSSNPSPAKEREDAQRQGEGRKPIQNPGAVETLVGRTIAEVERDMIINTLEHCLGNRTHAANILGISIRTLRNKLNQYKDEGVSLPPAAAAGGE